MHKLGIILFFSCGLIVTAQAQFDHHLRQRKEYDFSKVDTTKINRAELRKQLLQIRKEIDSVYVTRVDSLQQLSDYLQTRENDYAGILFSIFYSPGDYQELLNDLEDNGFDGSTDYSVGLTYGTTTKYNRFIHDFTVSLFWGEKMESESQERVRVWGANFFAYNFGFDLLNFERVNLFPFVGLNHQLTVIRYKRTGQSGNYSSLLDIPDDVDLIRIRKHALRFSAGAEFDVYLVKNKGVNCILGLRYGINQTLLESDFRAERSSIGYDPKVDLKSSVFEIVLRVTSPTQR